MTKAKKCNFTKRTITLPDGRYLIFYDFEIEQDTEEVSKGNLESGNVLKKEE